MTSHERVTARVKFAVGDEEYVAHFRAWRTPPYTYGADADGRRGETRQDIEDEEIHWIEDTISGRRTRQSDTLLDAAWAAFHAAKGDIAWESEDEAPKWEE